MTKAKILLFIPLALAALLLLYSWIVIIFTEVNATWQHYVAIGLFWLLIYFLIRSWTKAVLFTGIYLILGTCNLFSLEPFITTNSYGLRIGSLEFWTPSFQLVSFILFVIYFTLNFDTLVNIYLDYKEAKAKNQ